MSEVATVAPTPTWVEISLCTPPELVEAIANFLIDEDANGVVIEDVQEGEPFHDRRRMGWLWVRAYFPRDACAALEDRVHTYLDELSRLFPLSEPPVLDQRVPEVADWSQCWKKFFKPVMISDRIQVRPSWEDEPVPSGAIPVLIDPGTAFGTGKHPTTRLCVRALQEEILFPIDERQPKSVFSLLDVGTGSGILSIVAARMGVPRVLGVDVDPQAVTAARENVLRNELDDRIEVSEEGVEDLVEHFDVIMANIVAETLIAHKEHLVGLLAPDGMLILSGLLRNQGAWIKHEFLSLPLTFINALHEDEWCALVFQKI